MSPGFHLTTFNSDLLSYVITPGVSNRTKSNQKSIEPNRTSILRWVRFSNQSNQLNTLEHNRTQSGSILFGIHLLISKSRRTNHNQPLLNGINRKTSKYRTEINKQITKRTSAFQSGLASGSWHLHRSNAIYLALNRITTHHFIPSLKSQRVETIAHSRCPNWPQWLGKLC